MNYSDDPSMVRVDFFKESGKWYTTEAIKWLTYSGMLIQDAFEQSLLEAGVGGPKGRLLGMRAVCLESYHEHGHPLMIEVS